MTGTVEFIVDDSSGDFFFLEMNTRLQVSDSVIKALSPQFHRMQVEHGVTEMLYPGLDIVELMLLQGVLESSDALGLHPSTLEQARYAEPVKDRHAIEARVYCENPASGFSPCPGLLQYVEFPDEHPNVRCDSWVSEVTRIDCKVN